MSFQNDAYQNDTTFALPGFQVEGGVAAVSPRRLLTMTGVGYALAWFVFLSEAF